MLKLKKCMTVYFAFEEWVWSTHGHSSAEGVMIRRMIQFNSIQFKIILFKRDKGNNNNSSW
jgi:hypothetical protein